jgi:hypothetical protein
MRRLSDLARRRKGVAALYAVFTAVLIAIAAELLRSWLGDASASSSSVIGMFTLVGLALVLTQLVVLQVSVENLTGKSGLSIKYYGAGNAQEKEELHRQARKVIRRAPSGSHIYAVNSYLEVFVESNEPYDDEPQRDYLGEFERRFDEISYHRLIQLQNGDRLIQQNGDRKSAGAGHSRECSPAPTWSITDRSSAGRNVTTVTS